MSADGLNRIWLAVIIFVIVAIISGGIVSLSRYSPGKPVEITLPQPQEWQGTIHIDGAVNKPGSYPFRGEDSIDALLQAAGGTNNSANRAALELHVGAIQADPEAPATTGTDTQRIDINRADAKLLEALPGIGEVLAQRIIAYRQQNGPFRSTYEIIEVNGIGPAIYERIKDLITVSGQ